MYFKKSTPILSVSALPCYYIYQYIKMVPDGLHLTPHCINHLECKRKAIVNMSMLKLLSITLRGALLPGYSGRVYNFYNGWLLQKFL